MSLVESAASGDRLRALQDLRNHLAVAIEGCESLRDLASLSGRLQSVLEDIDELSGGQGGGDVVDEIARRRAARRAGSA